MDKGSYSLATNKLQGAQMRGFRKKCLMLTCQILLKIILLVYLIEGRRWPFFYSDGVFDVLHAGVVAGGVEGVCSCFVGCKFRNSGVVRAADKTALYGVSLRLGKWTRASSCVI